jgi:hypothetical protein
MTARRVVTPAGGYQVAGTGYAPEGRVRRDGRDATLDARPDLAALVETMAVCNDSAVAEKDGQWT